MLCRYSKMLAIVYLTESQSHFLLSKQTNVATIGNVTNSVSSIPVVIMFNHPLPKRKQSQTKAATIYISLVLIKQS